MKIDVLMFVASLLFFSVAIYVGISLYANFKGKIFILPITLQDIYPPAVLSMIILSYFRTTKIDPNIIVFLIIILIFLLNYFLRRRKNYIFSVHAIDGIEVKDVFKKVIPDANVIVKEKVNIHIEKTTKDKENLRRIIKKIQETKVKRYKSSVGDFLFFIVAITGALFFVFHTIN